MWRNLKCILLSERYQFKKATNSMIPNKWHSRKAKRTTGTVKRRQLLWVPGEAWGDLQGWETNLYTTVTGTYHHTTLEVSPNGQKQWSSVVNTVSTLAPPLSWMHHTNTRFSRGGWVGSRGGCSTQEPSVLSAHFSCTPKTLNSEITSAPQNNHHSLHTNTPLHYCHSPLKLLHILTRYFQCDRHHLIDYQKCKILGPTLSFQNQNLHYNKILWFIYTIKSENLNFNLKSNLQLQFKGHTGQRGQKSEPSQG